METSVHLMCVTHVMENVIIWIQIVMIVIHAPLMIAIHALENVSTHQLIVMTETLAHVIYVIQMEIADIYNVSVMIAILALRICATHVQENASILPRIVLIVIYVRTIVAIHVMESVNIVPRIVMIKINAHLIRATHAMESA